MNNVWGFLCLIFDSLRIFLNGYWLVLHSLIFSAHMLVNHCGQPLRCVQQQLLKLTWGLGLLWKKTDKFGGFHLTEEKTFVRGEGEVVMGDQWELDAEDQMGDTLCICGKVSQNLTLLSSCTLPFADWRQVPAITTLQTVHSQCEPHPIACSGVRGWPFHDTVWHMSGLVARGMREGNFFTRFSFSPVEFNLTHESPEITSSL